MAADMGPAMTAPGSGMRGDPPALLPDERPRARLTKHPVGAGSSGWAGLQALAAKARLDQWVPPVVFAGGFFAVWEMAVRALDVPLYLLPPPSAVLSTARDNAPLLLRDASVTLTEAALGLMVAFAFAALLALAFARFRIVERSLMPFVVAFQAVPVIAIAPLLVLWFGNGMAGKIVLAAIICFFPAAINLSRGLQAVSPAALTLMRSLSASPSQVLLHLRIPSAVPYMFAALRISATLSVIGAIVAELSGATRGIGFRIVISTYRTDTKMLFAALAFAILMGLAFYGLTALAERAVQRVRPFSRVVE